MESPILYFLLLVLEIPLDLCLNAGHERDGFSKALLEKGFEFVLSRRDNTIAFHLSFVLLPAEIDPFPKERGRKGDALVPHGINRVKMILALLAKVVALYMQAPIVQVGVFSLERPVLGCGVYLAIFQAFNKQF